MVVELILTSRKFNMVCCGSFLTVAIAYINLYDGIVDSVSSIF